MHVLYEKEESPITFLGERKALTQPPQCFQPHYSPVGAGRAAVLGAREAEGQAFRRRAIVTLCSF